MKFTKTRDWKIGVEVSSPPLGCPLFMLGCKKRHGNFDGFGFARIEMTSRTFLGEESFLK
jgi:hypothetical protein